MPVSGWLVLFAPFVGLVLFVAPPEDVFAAPVVPVAGVGAVSVVLLPLPLLLPLLLLFDVEVGGGAFSDIMAFFYCPTLLSCLFKKEVRVIAPVTVQSHSCFAGAKDVEVQGRSYQDVFVLFARGLQLMMRCSWIQPRPYSPHLLIPGCLLVLYLSIYLLSTFDIYPGNTGSYYGPPLNAPR